MQYVRNDALRAAPSACVAYNRIIPVAAKNSRPVSDVRRRDRTPPYRRLLIDQVDHTYLFPASHYVAGEERMKRRSPPSKKELDRLAWFRKPEQTPRGQRLRMRTTFDLEMLKEIGSCSGVEN